MLQVTAFLNGHTNQPITQDKLIISTAIPQITNEFHSADDIGWYGTAFLLSNCAFLLVFGKLYTIFNVKYTFLTAIFLFEVGSALCASAPSSIAFIIGRAISGLGAGGVQSGIVSTFSFLSIHFFKINLLILCWISLLSLFMLFHYKVDPNIKVFLVLYLELRLY
jgi:MFS family permease